MDAKTTYETAAAVAAVLPDAERQMFAELLTRLTTDYPPARDQRARAVRRWIRDADPFGERS